MMFYVHEPRRQASQRRDSIWASCQYSMSLSALRRSYRGTKNSNSACSMSEANDLSERNGSIVLKLSHLSFSALLSANMIKFSLRRKARRVTEPRLSPSFSLTSYSSTSESNARIISSFRVNNQLAVVCYNVYNLVPKQDRCIPTQTAALAAGKTFP